MRPAFPATRSIPRLFATPAAFAATFALLAAAPGPAQPPQTQPPSTAAPASAPADSAAAPAPAAAPLLSLSEAVRLGLERNHDLSLARDDRETAENNRAAGIGPFLPEVGADAQLGGVFGEKGTNSSLGASAGLILFDGFQSWHAYRRLRVQEEAAGHALRQEVEITLEAVMGGYYAIVQHKRRLEAIRELLAVSQERARLAQARMEVGAGSRLEQLQALSDLNTDSASWLGQQVALEESKLDLNRLLARGSGEEFDVEDTIPLEASLPVEAWKAGLRENNSAVLQARARRGASASGLKEARGAWLPDLNAGLKYSTTPDALAGNEVARKDGVAWSFSLSVPVFDRLRTRRDVANAKVGLRQDETRLRQAEQAAEAEFERALARHKSGLRRVALEEGNLEVSRLQAEAARERYRLGASSPLEFRDAQTRLLDSRSRLEA
ncbi:MAG TPA: TolC family protein, partial [Fibrobacteria bacterium]|nr:TolC family protein [Fibrobacteria bacterium]